LFTFSDSVVASNVEVEQSERRTKLQKEIYQYKRKGVKEGQRYILRLTWELKVWFVDGDADLTCV